MSDDVQADEGGDDIGVIVLMLGLYLIVLAFFILLNAISEDSPDQRDLVVQSVREGFDFREEGEGLGSDPTDITAPPTYEAVINSLDGTLQSYLQVDEFDISGNNERVQMRLDIDRFFYRGEVRIIPDMILFFEDLTKIINGHSAETRTKVQVLVSGDDTTLTNASALDAFSLAGRRSALFTRALIEEGVPQDSISAGTFMGAPSLVVTFHILTNATRQTSEQLHSIMDKADARATSGRMAP